MKNDEQFERILDMLGESQWIVELKVAMKEMTAMMEEFDAWKLEFEKRVFDLQRAMLDLDNCIKQLAMHRRLHTASQD